MALKDASRERSGQGLWPEEIEAIRDVKSGKTGATTKTRDKFLEDMEKHIRERRKKELEDESQETGKAA